LWFLAEICKFLYDFFYFEYKKNVYPVHTPAAVDYNMFNFGEFLSISNFVWRAFIIHCIYQWSKKRWAFGLDSGVSSHRNKYTYLEMVIVYVSRKFSAVLVQNSSSELKKRKSKNWTWIPFFWHTLVEW
jgi:hypothetical protein